MSHESKDFVKPSRKKKRIAIYIIISLFIHAVYFFFISEYGFQKNALSFIQSLMKNMTPEEKKVVAEKRHQRETKKIEAYRQQENKRQAQLRAGNSSFGWVYFQDAPPNKETQIPTNTEPPLEEVSQPLATEIKEQLAQSPAEQQKSPIQQKEIEIEKEIEKAIPEKKQLEAKITPRVDEKPTIIEAKKEPEELEQRIKAIEEEQQKYDHMVKMMQEGKLKVSPPAQQEQPATTLVHGAASHTEDKPKRNIIALTKGFIDNIGSGNDLVNQDGDPNIQSGPEEIGHIIYKSKIIWALQASWKQNFEKYAHDIQEGNVYVSFTLDEQGKVVTSELLKSTGHKKTDDIVMKTLQFSSIPPIPKYFNTKTYTVNLHIKVYAHKIGL